jgi:adenosylcobyric acid synthase
VLLKPRGDGESQLVVDGEAIGHFGSSEYYETHWETARDAAVAAHERLAQRHDLLLAEGAGSIAEINLHHRDLANVETARFAHGDASATNRAERPGSPQGADVLLVADIERGGVFASLVGTLELLPGDIRERVVGAVVTKFRGDRSLLAPGLESFEERTGVPVLGVLPYEDPGLPEEDSVSLPSVGETETWGDDAVDEARTVTIAVPRFPRASNVTDVEPLARVPGVRVRFVPLDASLTGDTGGHAADAILLTGTKNTVDDALAAREAGLYEELRRFDGPIVGLCGGYQLLGERLRNAAVEGTGDEQVVPGIGLLPVETRFSPEKTVEPVERDLQGCGPLTGASGAVSGYEIHMGDSHLLDGRAVEHPFADGGAALGDVLGTYLHGLFENPVAREAFVDRIYESAGRARPETGGETRSPYDRAADLVAAIDLESLDLPPARG